MSSILKRIAVIAAALIVSTASAKGPVAVSGYTRSNGTYVQPHYRSAPDGNFQNNWSTSGNVNPYTGKAGTKTSPPTNYGSDVQVQSFTRTNGTYVQPYHRSAPDSNSYNNWSAKGNTNPYTGALGTKVYPSIPSYYSTPGVNGGYPSTGR
jgi:hypothetical protein